MRFTLYCLLFVLLGSQGIHAQVCDSLNTDFEIWVDYTENFEDEEPLPEGTVVFPEGYFSFFRTFFSDVLGILFDALGGALGGEPIEEPMFGVIDDAFGFSRTEDASSGQFAVRIGGNEEGAFTDMLGVFNCSGIVPDSFHIDIKHVGRGVDTFSLAGNFQEEVLITDEDPADIAAAYYEVSLEMTGDTEYETISVPVLPGNPELSPDSLISVFVVLGDEAVLSSGVESYFIMDNMRFTSNSTVLAYGELGLEGDFNRSYNELELAYAEDDISMVTIERGMSAQGPFEELTSFEELSQTVYHDYEVDPYTVYYYRVKAEMHNGKKLLSEIISIQTEEIEQTAELQFVPNPATDMAYLHVVTSQTLTEVSGSLYDYTGRPIGQNQLPTVLSPGVHELPVSVSDLPSGRYFYRLVSAEQHIVEALIVE